MPLFDLEDYYMTYDERKIYGLIQGIIGWIVILTIAIWFIGGCVDDKKLDNAVSCIECGEYEKALEILEDIGGAGFSRLEKENKETLTLYAKARIAHEEGNDFIAYRTLDDISVEYDGELCDEIRQFKSYIYKIYRG